jgi:hypothetical protein
MVVEYYCIGSHITQTPVYQFFIIILLRIRVEQFYLATNVHMQTHHNAFLNQTQQVIKEEQLLF